MARIDGNTNASTGHRKVRDLQNLAGLVLQLKFLVRPTFVACVRTPQRQHIKRDWRGKLRRCRQLQRLAIFSEGGGPRCVMHLCLELGNPRDAGARYCLVGRGDQCVNCASTCRGLSTGIAAMVVQFGFATIRFGMKLSAFGFTSLTTKGTAGSMRQADELSITMRPSQPPSEREYAKSMRRRKTKRCRVQNNQR